MYYKGERNISKGAKRPNRVFGGICMTCAAEYPVLRGNTKETAETCSGASRAPCWRCSE